MERLSVSKVRVVSMMQVRIMERVPRSVLWLVNENRESNANILRQVRGRGGREESALCRTTPHHAAPCRTMPHHAAPHTYVAPCRTMPHHAAPCRTMPHHTHMSHHA